MANISTSSQPEGVFARITAFFVACAEIAREVRDMRAKYGTNSEN